MSKHLSQRGEVKEGTEDMRFFAAERIPHPKKPELEAVCLFVVQEQKIDDIRVLVIAPETWEKWIAAVKKQKDKLREPTNYWAQINQRERGIWINTSYTGQRYSLIGAGRGHRHYHLIGDSQSWPVFMDAVEAEAFDFANLPVAEA